MALTQTQIISNAVSILGHKPIITLDNPDQLVTAALQAYNFLLPAVLSSNNWRFAVAIVPLIQELQIPPPPWKAMYQLPAGFLKLIRLYPNRYDFDIFENQKIYTMSRQGFSECPNEYIPPDNAYYQGYVNLSIEYVFMPTTNLFPPHFALYFSWEIAAYLGLSNAQRPDYAAYLTQQRNYQFAMAAAIEAQNRPQFSQVLFPVLSNRNIYGFIGNGGGSW